MNMITSSPMLMEIVRMSLFLSLVRRLGQDFVGLVLLVEESAFLTECSGKGDENDDDVSVVFSFPLFEYRCFIPWPQMDRLCGPNFPSKRPQSKDSSLVWDAQGSARSSWRLVR